MDGGWQQVVSVLTKREPKTPMAFYSGLLWGATALIVAPLYSNIDPARKPLFVFAGAGLGIVVAIWVTIFAWIKPEHLLYGAEIHFEKWRREYFPGDYGSTKAQTPNLGGTPEEL